LLADYRARLIIGLAGVDDCMGEMAKIIIVIGVVLVLIGLTILFLQKVPFLGKLPVISDQKENFTFYFPLEHEHRRQHHRLSHSVSHQQVPVEW
jgi:hypothetical protein